MVENICEKEEKHRCTREKGKGKKLANIKTQKEFIFLNHREPHTKVLGKKH
jgi:hypothetical protein